MPAPAVQQKERATSPAVRRRGNKSKSRAAARRATSQSLSRTESSLPPTPEENKQVAKPPSGPFGSQTWDEFFKSGSNSRVAGFWDGQNFGDPWPEDSHPSRFGPPPDAEMSLRLDINIDVHVDIKAKVHGDVTLSLLYVCPTFTRIS
ncbi:hypothetical protein DL96DRAFT_1710546 [Flagelloscypha sp. PMI_526]|nr:hypothetical protein DL96DRAFT_1710546 [Flagelloscypha sp. PMI_526]